ncbi:unnamed protein product [Microthlaspi erraticum]|uniref:Uncharacterized protein n=1 Tax=Microthlaspi erraticum TaxID=1685480 RepID=A0A6D2JHD6_9BRAS|nr:unnamed protein product [Microthlaspi erraticum]
MGATVHCESFLPRHSSMRDLSEDDFNSCSLSSVYCGGDANLRYGDYQNERDFMKQKMLEQENVFKNQVHELHRLYRTQRNLVDEVKGKDFNEDMNLSDYTSGNASKSQLPGFLLANSTYGGGSSSQACNGRLRNGVSLKDGDVFEVKPVKGRRRMIDLQLPADAYLDTDDTGDADEITIFPPYKRSTSLRSNSSGSCLDVKNSNGLADLNEPLKWQDSEPVSLSRDMYSHYGRNNADVKGQWLGKNTSQNGWMVLGAGHEGNTQRGPLQLPSHSVQTFSNNAFQPQSYHTSDHSKVKFSGERSYHEPEVRSKNPQASYGSYVESSVTSNAPRSHNDHRPDFVRPWSNWSSSWENPRSSSHQTSYPVQTNPYMNFVSHARTDSSFEMRSRVSNGLYQGFSSGSKEPVFNSPSAGFKPNASLGEVVKHQSFESLKKQECSAGLPWLKPKPPCRSEISNGLFDLNASANQFMDGTDTEDDVNSVSHQKGLRSASLSNNANMGKLEMSSNPQSSREVIACPIFEKHPICKEEHTSLISHCQQKEVNHFVKRELDINLPYDASVSVDQHGAKSFCVEKKEGKEAAKPRHYIDLNSCASEDDEDPGLHSSLRVKTKRTIWIDLEAPPTLETDEEEEEEEEGGESLQEKTNEEPWGLMKDQDGNSMSELIKAAAEAIVAISLSDHQRHLDDAASSSTDAAAKSPLSWFADMITSCGVELERKLDGSPETTDCEGYRDEYSSGEIDYFEAKTLNLQQTKEEDYMPKPLVPENLILEGTGANRPRRGQARRGRPKRDFQRDTLPGLSSLSRHEVTEDLQLFGGLIKTRDYTSNSGVAARRNSKRKRLVANINQALVCPSMAQPMNESVPVVGLEDSKLTGWGKATRRPRRQRCPPATVILT